MVSRWSCVIGWVWGGLLLLAAASATAAPTPVRVGIFDFNPLCKTQGAGDADQNGGLFPAILREVAARENWRLEFVPGSLPECMKRLKTGEVDLVVAATYSQDAAEEFSFTRETVISTWAQVYAADKSRVQSLLDLADRNVGVVRDDPYIVELRTLKQRLNIECTFVEFNTYDDVFKALNEKVIDTGVIDRIYATLHENSYRVQRTPLIFSPVELRFAGAKDRSQPLIDALDYHLAQFKKDPKSFYYRQIAAVLGASEENHVSIYLWRSLIATGALLLLACAIGLFLRFQVKVKTAQLFHKNEELQLELVQRRLAEAAQLRLMTAVEQSDDAIIITDRVGLVQYANPAFERTTGYSCDEAIGQPLEYLPKIPRTSAEPLATSELSLPEEPWKGRFTSTHKGGAEYEIATTLSPVHSPEGAITHYAWVCRDVTNEVQMERHLRQAQKMEAIGTLAGGIAHDFNNILFPIIGFTELVRNHLPAGDSQRQRLENVLTSANRARDLVRQILSFSRRLEESRRSLQVPPIVKETMRLLRASLPSTIEVRQTIGECEGQVLADATQIHQVLMNLCTNAYHAMREDGGILSVVLGEVEISPSDTKAHLDMRPGRYVRITISDTGCGMDRATLERIYDPYFTTKAAGEGTGLGLFLVHGIVKSHDGFIHVYSETGKGTTFQIYLPVARKERETRPMLTTDAALTGSGHILLVDDEETITSLLQQMLEEFGYEVTARNSGHDALKAFREDPDRYDLVITDQTMPHMTGTQLAQIVTGIRPGIPIILCSGFFETITEEQGRALGIRRFLTKPVLYGEFSHAVHQVLEEAAERV